MRISCKNLSFSYEPKKKPINYALKDVNIDIEEGEFFGIIGQTGSGKSTLIQHFNGLLPLQSGSLAIGDFDLSGKMKKKEYKKRLKLLRSKVGMVFQYPEYQLFAETVFDDVAFGLKNFFPDLKNDEIARRVCLALTAVGLNFDEIKNKSPFDLSGGQKRRVAIAGVIVTDPEILVLDEPVAGLDPEGKKELMGLLHNLLVGNRTIIIVSHDMDEVCENCSKVAVMQDGEIVANGTPEEVFESGKEFDGLILPLTARLKMSLKDKNIDLGGGLKTQEFIDNVAKYYRNKNR